MLREMVNQRRYLSGGMGELFVDLAAELKE